VVQGSGGKYLVRAGSGLVIALERSGTSRRDRCIEHDRIIDLVSGAGDAIWWFDGTATLKVTGEQSGGLDTSTPLRLGKAMRPYLISSGQPGAMCRNQSHPLKEFCYAYL
jgi:hypothetical protein